MKNLIEALQNNNNIKERGIINSKLDFYSQKVQN